MAVKGSRPGRIETEIEKYRGDGNWSRVLDLSRQLSAKTPHLGNCQNSFVLGYNANIDKTPNGGPRTAVQNSCRPTNRFST